MASGTPLQQEQWLYRSRLGVLHAARGAVIAISRDFGRSSMMLIEDIDVLIRETKTRYDEQRQLHGLKEPIVKRNRTRKGVKKSWQS